MTDVADVPVRQVARAAVEHRARAIRPTGAVERHARRIVVENHFIRLMPDRPQCRDRRAGAKQVIGQKRHLVVRAQVFDHLRAGDFGALKVPRSVLVLVTVARMEIEDLVREIPSGCAPTATKPGRSEREPRFQRFKCQAPSREPHEHASRRG